MSTRHNLSFCACKIAWWAPELPVSMCPSSHQWFLHAKQRILDQNYKSPWVPDLICGFWMQNSDFWARLTNLYGYQNSPVVLCAQNSVISTRITSLYGFQPSSVFSSMQNSDFRTRLTSLYWSHTSSVVLSTHNSVLSTRIKRLYGFQPTTVVYCMQISDFNTWITSLYCPSPLLWFLHAKQRLLDQHSSLYG